MVLEIVAKVTLSTFAGKLWLWGSLKFLPNCVTSSWPRCRQQCRAKRNRSILFLLRGWVCATVTLTWWPRHVTIWGPRHGTRMWTIRTHWKPGSWTKPRSMVWWGPHSWSGTMHERIWTPRREWWTHSRTHHVRWGWSPKQKKNSNNNQLRFTVRRASFTHKLITALVIVTKYNHTPPPTKTTICHECNGKQVYT